MMGRGIKVVWAGESGSAGSPEEIEHSCGIDVERLDKIPQLASVPAEWPRHDGRTVLECIVEAHCKRRSSGEEHLIVRHDRASNEYLVEAWDEEVESAN
ncbi:MAG: hypothetical protein F4213_18555 [Boseongicola sp. SB0677_bin_26]|nr:hypothetical protein [Boseongicola sp. SB0665_bin_10]MYG27994.1 hypothetical protein [Boseongicola sp. SB0677_bin_26]